VEYKPDYLGSASSVSLSGLGKANPSGYRPFVNITLDNARGSQVESIRKILNNFKKSKLSEEASSRTNFSYRELQVLERLTEGKSNQEIADNLCLSVDTIKSHLKSIYKKLGVCNRLQAIKLAITEGFIHLGYSPAKPDSDSTGKRITIPRQSGHIIPKKRRRITMVICASC